MRDSVILPSNGLVAGTDQFILSGGNVGIGTATPDVKVQILGDVHVGNELGFENGAGWNKNVLIDAQHHGRFRIRASNYTYGDVDAYFYADSSTLIPSGIRSSHDFGIDAMGNNVVFPNGNVGIGTMVPNSPLDIRGPANSHLLELRQSSGIGPSSFVELRLYGDDEVTDHRYAAIREVNVGGANRNELAFLTGEDSVVSEKVRISASGNVGIGTNNPAARLQVLNATCDGTTWINSSDRNLKQNFQAVQSREILARLAALPIQSWNYKGQSNPIRHIGPMAQDFQAAFDVGEDDKHISTVDADGVALAAIQALHEILKEKDAEIQALKKDLAEVKDLVRILVRTK